MNRPVPTLRGACFLVVPGDNTPKTLQNPWSLPSLPSKAPCFAVNAGQKSGVGTRRENNKKHTHVTRGLYREPRFSHTRLFFLVPTVPTSPYPTLAHLVSKGLRRSSGRDLAVSESLPVPTSKAFPPFVRWLVYPDTATQAALKGDVGRFERMPPAELLGVIEGWADELRKVIADG